MDEVEKPGPDLASGIEREGTPSAETNGRSWIERQKDRLSDLGKSFFTTEQHGDDKFMNIAGKVDGILLIASGVYINAAAAKISPTLSTVVTTKYLGADLILMGLAGVGVATYQTWRSRHLKEINDQWDAKKSKGGE